MCCVARMSDSRQSLTTPSLLPSCSNDAEKVRFDSPSAFSFPYHKRRNSSPDNSTMPFSSFAGSKRMCSHCPRSSSHVLSFKSSIAQKLSRSALQRYVDPLPRSIGHAKHPHENQDARQAETFNSRFVASLIKRMALNRVGWRDDDDSQRCPRAMSTRAWPESESDDQNGRESAAPLSAAESCPGSGVVKTYSWAFCKAKIRAGRSDGLKLPASFHSPVSRS